MDYNDRFPAGEKDVERQKSVKESMGAFDYYSSLVCGAIVLIFILAGIGVMILTTIDFLTGGGGV